MAAVKNSVQAIHTGRQGARQGDQRIESVHGGKERHELDKTKTQNIQL